LGHPPLAIHRFETDKMDFVDGWWRQLSANKRGRGNATQPAFAAYQFNIVGGLAKRLRAQAGVYHC
jgi:hypothetical protein